MHLSRSGDLVNARLDGELSITCLRDFVTQVDEEYSNGNVSGRTERLEKCGQ
jgi:hypothetical protein